MKRLEFLLLYFFNGYTFNQRGVFSFAIRFILFHFHQHFLHIVNGFRFLLLHQNGQLNRLLFFKSYNSADLSRCQRIDDRLILLCDFDLFLFIAVRCELSSKLIGCLRVWFWFNENHSSSNSIWLFLQPLLGIVCESDGDCTDLTRFSQLHRDS